MYDILTADMLREISLFVLTKANWLLNFNSNTTNKEIIDMLIDEEGKLVYSCRGLGERPAASVLCFNWDANEVKMSLSCPGLKYQSMYVMVVDGYVFDPINRILGVMIPSWAHSQCYGLVLNEDKSDKITPLMAKWLVDSYVSVPVAALATFEGLEQVGLQVNVYDVECLYKNGQKPSYATKPLGFVHNILDEKKDAVVNAMRDLYHAKE